MAKKSGNNKKKSYFRHKWEIYLMAILFYAFGAAIHFPDWVTWHLGPIGQLALYCTANYAYWTEIIFSVIIGAHIIESILAAYLCWLNNLDASSTIKWTLQTFFTGLGSLISLVKYYYRQKELKSS